MSAKAKKGPNWSQAEISTFLQLCIEKRIVQVMDCKKFKHVDIFKMLVRRMSEQGYQKTPEQMKLKLKKLKQEYVNCKKNNSISGAAPSTCPFYEELDLLFSLRPYLAVNSDCTGEIDTGDYETEQESETPVDSSTNLFAVLDDQVEDEADFDPGEGTSRNSETLHSVKICSNVQGEQVNDGDDFDSGESTSRNSETSHSAKRRCFNVQAKKGPNWSQAEISTFLQLCIEKRIVLLMDSKKFRHVDIFKMLVRGMSKQGYQKTPEQMKLKLKKLKQEYVNLKKNNSKSGAAPSTRPFYEELDLLFSLRPNLAVNSDCTHRIDTGDYETEQESETPVDSSTNFFPDDQVEDEADFDPGEGTSRNSETLHSVKRCSNVQGEQVSDWDDFDPGEGTSRNSETSHSAKRRCFNVQGRKSYQTALNEYSEKLIKKQETLINNTITKMLNSQKEMLETANREQRQWESEMLKREQEFQRQQTETMMRMFTQCIQSLITPTMSNLGPLRVVNITSQRNLKKDVEVEKENNESG